MRRITARRWLLASSVLLPSACGPEPMSTDDAAPGLDGSETTEADTAYARCPTDDEDLVRDCDEADGLVCLRATSIAGADVCVATGCATASDCAAPPADTAAVTQCRDDIVDGVGVCVLACSAQHCPSGMLCADGICLWPDER